MSLFKGRGNSLSFAEFDNYTRLINDDIVIKALINTLVFSAILIPAVLILSVLLANAISNIKSSAFSLALHHQLHTRFSLNSFFLQADF